MEAESEAEEAAAEWWWLSFADPELPLGQQFLGVAIVRGYSLESAIREAWRLKINPGGEVAAISLPEGSIPGEEYRERLLDRATAAGPMGRKHLFGDQTIVKKRDGEPRKAF